MPLNKELEPDRDGAMNEILLDAFRHRAWAMKTLIAACESVSAEKLERPALGYGSILATLNHLVLSDAGYLASLGGGAPSWRGSETNDLREILTRAEEIGDRWQRFLQEPIDGERIVTLDEGVYETHAVVVLVQALHHASVHGEQVCASLQALGVEPPDLQPWALADATGRSRWLRSQE